MAQEKQHWKDTLRSAQQEGNRQDDKLDLAEKKRRSTWMYRKRKLDKDVRQYYTNTRRIESSEIERIGRRHKFYITGTQPREN